jgi:hypothetical protein
MIDARPGKSPEPRLQHHGIELPLERDYLNQFVKPVVIVIWTKGRYIGQACLARMASPSTGPTAVR